MFQWLKREGRCGDVRGGKCEGVSVVEVGRIQLPLNSLTDPALHCSEKCLPRWDGRGDMTSQWRDFTDRDTQDLASLLATSCTTELSLTAHHTDLHTLGEVLRRRMPLPPHHILPLQRPHTSTRSGMETDSVMNGTGTELLSSELCGVCLHVSVCDRQAAAVRVLYR